MTHTTYRLICFFIVVLLLLFSALIAKRALAEGVVLGPDCRIVLDLSAVIGATGSRLYFGAAADARNLSADLGTATETRCSALALADGQWYIAVRPYNAAGEGAESTVVPFVLVTAPPAGVPALQVLPITP